MKCLYILGIDERPLREAEEALLEMEVDAEPLKATIKVLRNYPINRMFFEMIINIKYCIFTMRMENKLIT